MRGRPRANSAKRIPQRDYYYRLTSHHDQIEAMTLGDRVGRYAGRNRCSKSAPGSPAVIYERPANLFVAAFIGIASYESPGTRPIVRRVCRTRRHRCTAPVAASDELRRLDASSLGYPSGDFPLGLRKHGVGTRAVFPHPYPRTVAVRNDLGGMIEVLFPVSGRAADRPELSSAMEGGRLRNVT